MEAEIAKLMAETMKINTEARWYPFIAGAGAGTVMLGAWPYKTDVFITPAPPQKKARFSGLFAFLESSSQKNAWCSANSTYLIPFSNQPPLIEERQQATEGWKDE